MVKFIKKMFVNNEKYNNMFDEELIDYSLITIKNFIVNLFFTVIIGAILGKIGQIMCFYITFLVLRKTAGGIHLKSNKVCMIISLLIFFVSAKIANLFVEMKNFKLNYIIVFLSIMLLAFFSPISNINKPLSRKQKNTFKILVCFLSVLFGIISILLQRKYNSYSFYLSFAMLDVSVLVLIAKLIEYIKYLFNELGGN